ncbi:MAG: molybdopterin oxidoreductase [Bdellovibrio sp. CG10_big_fil_rev_8_21_14_0_10_47_8]|nr:MAG: molybdopterin oxidoreductase [Bdellovibrio sp. CG10_big_fil_rev_8_21_14_0_10_47_8]
MAGTHSTNLHLEKYEPSQRLKTASYAFIAIGVIGFLVGLLKNQDRLWTSYLVAFYYVTCLGVGGLFFTAIQNVAKAGWSTSIRRISEGMTSFLPVVLVGSVVLLAGLKKLYPWANAEVVAGNPMIEAKVAYLNVGFLVVRLLIFALGMLFFGKKIVGNSLKQDSTGDENLTHKNVGWSIGWILFFSLSFSLFSVDLLMSLLPTWYSTIFGIYCFSGLFQSSLAFMILIMLYMKRQGVVQGYYTIDHVHDVAKYLKAFTVFWAYIAFSQFMLIWYANIPEETEFYLLRADGGWMAISMSLLFFKFIIPFLALLPRGAKRNESHLTVMCVLILVMQYVDIYWLVYPNFYEGHVVFGFYEISMLLLFLGIFLSTMMKFFQKNSVVALKDPRLHEALTHHVTY